MMDLIWVFRIYGKLRCFDVPQKLSFFICYRFTTYQDARRVRLVDGLIFETNILRVSPVNLFAEQRSSLDLTIVNGLVRRALLRTSCLGLIFREESGVRYSQGRGSKTRFAAMCALSWSNFATSCSRLMKSLHFVSLYA